MPRLIKAVYFLGILSGCFIGPTLDRWFGEPQQLATPDWKQGGTISARQPKWRT